MATAGRWGYETRVDEENASYPPEPIFSAGRIITMAERRAARDAAYSAPVSYLGGPVGWEDPA